MRVRMGVTTSMRRFGDIKEKVGGGGSQSTPKRTEFACLHAKPPQQPRILGCRKILERHFVSGIWVPFREILHEHMLSLGQGGKGKILFKPRPLLRD